MGITLGTDHSNNLALTLRFRFNGTDVSWGQPYRINSFSNSAESVDGKYRISDLDVYFPDTNGSIFATAFGRGTNGLGTSCEVIAYVGGTLEYTSQGIATIFKSIGTAGAAFATIHTGNVFGIGYENRLLRIRSKSKLGQLSSLKWCRPITAIQNVIQLATVYGSYAFQANNLYSTTYPYLGSAFYNVDNDKTKWKMLVYLHTTANLYTEYPPTNRATTFGLNDGLPYSPYWYFPGTQTTLGTNFYEAFTPVSLEATYMSTYVGTIEDSNTAREYGFRDTQHAESAKSGSVYTLNRTRFKVQSGSFSTTATWMYTAGTLRVKGSPKECYEQMMIGACSTPLFTSSDLDTTTLNALATVTSFSYYEKLVPPDEADVLDSLRDIFDSSHGLFCVNASNKFEFRAYGPLNLHQSIPTWGAGSVVSSSFENQEEDYYTRYIVNYRYDWTTKNYNAKTDLKASLWALGNDRPLVINSKWIISDNEANTLCQRTKLRYAKTFPRIKVQTNINKIGVELGSLVAVTDADGGLSNKTLQIVGYEKDWDNMSIAFEMLDAESLFQRRGYAFWEGDSSLTNVVSGTSTAGWGTGGTVNNINGTIYGSMFVWW